MQSLRSRLLPHEAKDIDKLAQHRSMKLSILDWLAHCWDFEAYGRAEGKGDDYFAHFLPTWQWRFQGWTLEQKRIGIAIEHAQRSIDPTLAIARRVVMDSPADLALSIALYVRLQWFERRLGEQSGIGASKSDTLLIPQAMSVRDLAMAQRLMDGFVETNQYEVEALIIQSIRAAMARDMSALRPLAARLNKRKVGKWQKWLCKCFQGIVDSNTQLVAEGLQQRIEDEYRNRKKEEGNIVCLEAHQYYRLCAWVSPELVSSFDVTQPAPWDAAFHAWTEAHPNPLEGIDLSGISPVLHDGIINFKLPEWWRVLSQPEWPRDPCMLVLKDVGPNPKKIKQIIETYYRMWQRPPPDLEQAVPFEVMTDIPRATAFALGAQIYQEGGLAEIQKLESNPL